MSRAQMVLLVGCLLAALVLAGADAGRDEAPVRATAEPVVSAEPVQPGIAPVVRPEPGDAAVATAGQAANFNLNWYSINSGGAVDASSANYRAGVSVGQAAAGEASSANYRMQIGFWAGASTQAGGCPITVTGDVNLSGAINSSDIIYVVNFVFKGGPDPQPCPASADVNCTGAVNSSDIIYLVNYVFKGGSAPCDACTSSLAASC